MKLVPQMSLQLQPPPAPQHQMQRSANITLTTDLYSDVFIFAWYDLAWQQSTL